MLPQLANFIDKGGIQIFVEELIYPVTRLVTPLASLVMDKNQVKNCCKDCFKCWSVIIYSSFKILTAKNLK